MRCGSVVICSQKKLTENIRPGSNRAGFFYDWAFDLNQIEKQNITPCSNETELRKLHP